MPFCQRFIAPAQKNGITTTVGAKLPAALCRINSYLYRSMEIKIIAFGIAKDIIGQQQLPFVVEKPYTVYQLKTQLFKRYPKFVEVQSIKVAVNETYAKDDQILQANDEIVLIPPVSGG